MISIHIGYIPTRKNILSNFRPSKIRLNMQTAIRPVSSYKASDSLILLIDDKATLPKGLFSKAETDFIKKEIKADKKSIAINQFRRMVMVHQVDKKSELTKALEKCRKAGDS